MNLFCLSASRTLQIAIIASFLAGCVTSADRQYKAMINDNQGAWQTIEECSTAIFYSSDFEPLRRHTPFSVNQATLQQMTDSSLATEDEIAAFFKIQPEKQACRTPFLNRISQTMPTLAAVWASMFAKSDDSVIDLIKKRQSWGDHIRRLRDASAEADSQAALEGHRIAEGLQRSNDAELARRQAAVNAMLQYNQTQQIINNMNRPVLTYCNQHGSATSCMSR
jgi:hypothetical protein